MINKDSVVTAYDEHLTLVEWLQKVETALDNAVLTNLGIAKLNDQGNIATYQVTATFADNTTIVSDTFTLPSTDIVTAFSNLTTLVNSFDTRITDNTNKVARALLTPSSAPSTRKVVTIDTNGAQDNVDTTELPTLMDNIVDSHGNKRFAEFNGVADASLPAGVTITYNKASLSGTHLMLVLAGTIANGVTIPANQFFTSFNLPSYIANKIVPVWSNVYIERKNLELIADTWTSQNLSVLLYKVSNRLIFYTPSTLTLTDERHFRIQFDLLIDNE